ncbi:MAG TPA: hypothetical protein VNU46_07860 [Gemmatimonadaceae bacterium]|nr:hypothetical protein [Gemmatimonadaceae bacterium]
MDGVIGRCKALMAFLVGAMNGTRTTDVQYRIQRLAPVVVGELDRAEGLRRAF